jgi:hypothetical protein
LSRSGYITLPRRQAAVKLRSARRATAYFQLSGGTSYESEIPVVDVVHAFERNPQMRLQIRLSDSQHDVVDVHNREVRRGYLVEF